MEMHKKGSAEEDREYYVSTMNEISNVYTTGLGVVEVLIFY